MASNLRAQHTILGLSGTLLALWITAETLKKGKKSDKQEAVKKLEFIKRDIDFLEKDDQIDDVLKKYHLKDFDIYSLRSYFDAVRIRNYSKELINELKEIYGTVSAKHQDAGLY